MRVKIQFMSNSIYVEYAGVMDVYTKDQLLCLLFDGGVIFKFPLCNIFCVVSDYEVKE